MTNCDMVPKMLLYERHIFLMTPYRGFLKCNQQNQFLVVADIFKMQPAESIFGSSRLYSYQFCYKK